MIEDNPGIFLALAFGLPGTLILSLGLFCFIRDRRSLPEFSEFGEGTVIGLTEYGDEGHTCPRVLFVHGKKMVTITGSVGSIPPAYKIGQKVPVRYIPGRPSSAIIADFRNLHLGNYGLIFFGTVSVLVAGLLLVLQIFVD